MVNALASLITILTITASSTISLFIAQNMKDEPPEERVLLWFCFTILTAFATLMAVGGFGWTP